MYQVDIYAVERVGTDWLVVGSVGLVAVLSAFIVMRFGWRAWWTIILAAIAIPTIAVLSAGGAWPGDNWPLIEYVLDVVLPLAVLGLVGAIVGCALGVSLRWLARRTASQ